MGTFIKSKNNTNNIMKTVLYALLPIILYSLYIHGYVLYDSGKINFIQIFYPILFILVGCLTSSVIELFYSLIFKKKDWKNYLKNSYSFFPGLFLALILPLETPIYILIIGCVIASISKVIFGGFGKNMFNPAIVGYIFIMIIFASIFSNNLNSDLVTPLSNASSISGIGSYDELVKPYGSLMDLFIGNIPGSIASTSTFLCLLAFIFLTITKTIKWRISVSYVASVFIVTYVIGRFLDQGVYYPLFHILSGGLIFTAVFMATDPVTSCVTPIGQVFQGIFLGILTVIFRFIGFDGMFISILIMNGFVTIFDKIGATARFNFIKTVIWFLVSCILIVIISIALAAIKRNDSLDYEINEYCDNQIII